MTMIEPWILAIVLLVVVPLHMLVGTILARGSIRKVATIGAGLLSDPSVTSNDRRQVRRAMREASSPWPLRWIAVSAPLWSLPLIVMAISDALRRETPEELLDDARRQLDELAEQDARFAQILQERKTMHSEAYKASRNELDDATVSSVLLSSPLLAGWIMLWAAPALVVYAAAGLAGAAVTRFRLALDSFLHYAFGRTAS